MAYDFDTIASNYDRMNRLMTLGLDKRWRKRAVRGLHGNVLDVACGTGDMVVCLAKQGCTVTGVDISEEMLAIARQKTASAVPPRGGQGGCPHLSPLTSSTPLHFGKESKLSMRSTSVAPTFHLANAESLPFEDNTFDAVTCAFGVRNFVHLEQGLNEMLRVLKPGGTMVILELATPDSPIVRPFYNLYTKHIIPWLGKRIAGSREAYTYLPTSIEHFPKGGFFWKILLNSKFKVQHCRQRKLTFGVCRLYTLKKHK